MASKTKTAPALDPANLAKAPTIKGAIPNVMEWTDADGNSQTTSIHDVVMSYDASIHGPWRAPKGSGKHNGGFYNGSLVNDCLDRNLVVNETGLNLLIEGKTGDIAASISAHTQTWVTVSSRWSPDSGYGNQHFTGQGPMHFNGVDRLTSESVAMNASCFMEVLAQRAAMVDLVTDEASKAECAAAANLLKGIADFAKTRPAAVKDATRQRAYAAIASEEGKVLTSKTEAAA